MLYPDTTSWESVEKYLDTHMDIIEDANNEEVMPYIMPIFISPLTDDPKIMIMFHTWLDKHVSTDLRYIIESNLSLLDNVDLNKYKLKIIMGIRGPIDGDIFDEYVEANSSSDTVIEIAKHKDFPQSAKDIMYKIHKDVDYLSAEIKESFIF